MKLRSNPESIIVMTDPLSATSNITQVSGNAVQFFNKETQEYVPDRRAVPLILMATVSVIDPTGKMTGSPALTGIEWYGGAPQADGSNRIAAGGDYEIGDGTVEGFPKYALKVKGNIPINAPVEIYAVAIFTDTRTNKAVRVTNSIKLYTSYQDLLNLSLKITDRPAGFMVNPLEAVPDGDGRWPLAITAQLYTGKEAAPDENSAYWWEVKGADGAWRDFTADELEDNMVISGKNADGTWNKRITLDTRYFDNCELRVQAAYYNGVKPSAPTSEELSATVAVKVEFPRSLGMDVHQTKGAKMAADLNTPVTFTATIYDNKHIYDEESYGSFFPVKWKALSGKPGSTEKEIGGGEGFSVSFTPKALGFDPAYPVQVYAEVDTVKSSVVPAGALYDTDGSIIVDTDGAYIVME